MKLLLATSNRHKVEEIKYILADTDFIIYTLHDFPEIILPPEDGATFEANASIKALAAAKATGLLTLADDSGLEVDYLSGAPGVYSARFAGEEKNDVANNAKLLRLLEGVPRQGRTARFRCAIAIALPGGGVKVCNGCCEGIIGEKPVGEGGFGYDSLLYLPQLDKTVAQLSMAEKNTLSHRAKALAKANILLQDLKEQMK